MATYECRGYCKKPELKTSSKGEYFKCTISVQQKRKDKTGTEVKENLYVNVVDFNPKDVPVEGEYIGVSGYVTISKWEANGKSGINIDLTAKNWEKLPQKDGGAKPWVGGTKAADLAPPSDPFALSPGKP